MRKSASDTQRAWSPSGTPFGSAGDVSQPNSVTQKATGRDEVKRPCSIAAFRSFFIFRMSPSEIASRLEARCVGPPEVYGWWLHTSAASGGPQLGIVFSTSERHSTSRMNR